MQEPPSMRSILATALGSHLDELGHYNVVCGLAIHIYSTKTEELIKDYQMASVFMEVDTVSMTGLGQVWHEFGHIDFAYDDPELLSKIVHRIKCMKQFMASDDEY